MSSAFLWSVCLLSCSQPQLGSLRLPRAGGRGSAARSRGRRRGRSGLPPQLLRARAAGTSRAEGTRSGKEGQDTEPRSRLELGKCPEREGRRARRGRRRGAGEASAHTETHPVPPPAVTAARSPRAAPAHCRRPPEPTLRSPLSLPPGRELRRPHARSGAAAGRRKVSAVPWGWAPARLCRWALPSGAGRARLS